MVLSSKQVSGDGIDWGQTLLQGGSLELHKPPMMRRQQQQQQQQQLEPLKCPRCDSTNTKFCYFNNYNKSQPRHFCKSCKRHWTKGGTLRNVPVGGGRKNKRPKTSATATAAAATPTVTSSPATPTTSSITNRSNINMGIQTQQQRKSSLALGDHEKSSLSDILYQAFIRPPLSVMQQNSIGSSNGMSMASIPSLPPNQNLHFPFRSLSSFDTNPSSIPSSFQPSNVYNYTGEAEAKDGSTTACFMPSTSGTITQPWQMPAASSVVDTTNYWSWDDIDTFVSTDLNIPWDDSEIKP